METLNQDDMSICIDGNQLNCSEISYHHRMRYGGSEKPMSHGHDEIPLSCPLVLDLLVSHPPMKMV